MEATLDRIKTARNAGYSDDEIYAHLGSKDTRFSKAQEAGYTLDEVGSFLSRKEPVQADASFRNSPDAPPAPISDAPYRQIRQELKDEEKSQPLSDMVMRAVAGTAKAGLQTAAGVLNLADYTPQMQVNKLMGSDALDREVKSFIRDAADRTDESYYVEKNFDKKLASEIIGAGTSLVPIIASGPGGVAGQVIAGAALAGESARKEAEVGGADELQQQKAFLVNAAVGAATEKLLGLPATLRSITAAARNTAVKGAAKEIAQETLKGFGREGTQEVLQEVSKDLEAKFISAYDPERNAFDTKKLTKTFLIGGLLGGVVGGGGRAAVEIQGAIDARAEAKITENLPEAALDAGTGPIDASLEAIAQATPPPFPSTPPPLPVKAEETPVTPPAQEAPQTEIPRLSTIQIDAEGNPVKDDQGKYVQVYADTGEVVEKGKQGVQEPQASRATQEQVEPAEAFKPFLAQAVEAAKAAGAIDPEAAAQEAWVDVSRQVTEGKSNLDNPKALLTLAAKRKAFEQVKAEEAQKRGGGQVGSLNEPDLSGRTVEETQGTPIGPRAETIAEEDSTRIQAKLDSLPPLQAASIRGMAEGLSDAEIAAQNNTSEGAVKQARLRGRKAMQAFIQKEGIGQSMGPGAAASSEVLAKFEEKAFGKRLSEDESLESEIREDLSSGYYEIPNRVTVDQANELIDTVPEKQLLRLVTDEDSGASYADRVTVGLVMMRKLNERFKSQKQTDPEAARQTLQDAIDMGEASSELGLRLGQGVQSFAIWNKLSPEGKLIAVQRAVKKARNRHKKDNQAEIDEIKDVLNAPNTSPATKKANFEKLTKKNKTARKAKNKAKELIKESENGPITDKQLYDKISKDLGLLELTPEQAAQILHLAELAEQAPEGMPKEDAEFELNKYIASIKGFKASDLLIGVYYGNILSGTGTQAVNLADTALNVVSEVNTLALSDPKAASAIMSGMIRGLDNGRFDAVVAFTKGRRISDGKFVDTPYLMEVARFGKEGVPINVTGKASALTKAFAEKASYLNAYKYVQRAMSASDSLMFRSAQEAKASQIAFDMAYNSGLRGEALSSEIDRILALDRAEEFLAQAEREGYTGSTARARATELMIIARPEGLNKDSTEFASEATYNYKPYGLAGSISASIEKFGQEYPVLKAFVVPFTRIVANVFNRGLNNSPYGYIRALRGKSGSHVFTDSQRQAMLVRANVSVAALSTLGVLHALGIIAISGQGPTDPEKRKQLRETGWKPYSIKIGDTYFSYSMLPVGMSLAVMGNFLDGQKYNELGQKDGLQRLQYAFTSVGSTLFSQSFLSGLTPIFDLISGKNPGGAVSAGNRIVSQTATGVAIPFASLVKDVNQLFDPSLRKPKNFLQALISDIPFVRTALRPSINALGEEINVGRFRLLNRFGSRQKDDKAWKLVADKNLRVPVPGPFFTEPEKDYEYNQKVGKKIKAWMEENEDYLRGKTTTEAQESLEGFSDKTRKEVRQSILFQGGKKKLKKGEVPKTSAVDLMYSGK